ncbi:hypothetical protein GGF31_005669 [Allomyces arbusculus]|nr:hypothetical protein GGF31_005669 [Allomyces arbusculus]
MSVMSVPSGPADPMERFALKADRLLLPVDTNEYFLPPVCTLKDIPLRVDAREMIIRREEYDKTFWLECAELLDEQLSGTPEDHFNIASHPAFKQVVLVALVKAIAMYSKLRRVCNADTGAVEFPGDSTDAIDRKANIDSAFVSHCRLMGMSNRSIAIALAVRLGLPLSQNVMCNAVVPLTPPLSPYFVGIGIGSDNGAARFGSDTDEAMIDLADHYKNALQLEHTNWADLVVLVYALAKLLMLTLGKLKLQVERDATLGILPGE